VLHVESRPDERIGTVADGDDLQFERVWSVLERFTKAASPVCQRCDLVDSCQACLGQMISVNSAQPEVVPSQLHCEWLAGTVEGLAEGVLAVRQDERAWRALESRMA
jgi:hypothetical protein